MHHTYDCLHVSFPHLDVTKQATQHDAELKLEHAQADQTSQCRRSCMQVVINFF